MMIVFFALNTFVHSITEAGSNGGKSVTQKFICVILIEFKKAVKYRSNVYRSIPFMRSIAKNKFMQVCRLSR